jgi:membrane associated rhomboid family serine protease
MRLPDAGRDVDRRPASRRAGVLLVAALAGVMWVTEVVDALTAVDLDGFGIEPRETAGLPGIVLAPFLHGGFGHLISNTVPFLVMGALIALSGLARVLAVTVVVALVAGLGTWLLGSPGSVHLGASSLVFGYAAYLLARGVFTRRVLYVATAVLVAFVWGSALLGGLLPRQGVSWTGHAFGAAGGVLAAYLLAQRQVQGQPRPGR